MNPTRRRNTQARHRTKLASIKPEQLDEVIRSGKLGRVYLFDGPENFLKDRAVSKIIQKLIPDSSKDFNLERFNGDMCSASDIINAIQSLPFLGEKRVVVLSNADALSAAESRLVADMMPHIPESTCFLMIWEGKANMREAIPAQASSMGGLVTCWTPFPNLLPSWLIQEAKQRGKPIAPDAAHAICDACSDLQQIVNEYEKISLYVGKKPRIEMSDVQSHGFPDEDGNYKDLEEAIFQRNFTEVLRQGRLMTDSGVRPESMFPVFERVFRSLVLAQHMRDQEHKPMAEIFTSLGIRSRSQQANLQRGMTTYRNEDVKSAFDKIAQADYELKTGTLPAQFGISLLALNVCRR